MGPSGLAGCSRHRFQSPVVSDWRPWVCRGWKPGSSTDGSDAGRLWGIEPRPRALRWDIMEGLMVKPQVRWNQWTGYTGFYSAAPHRERRVSGYIYLTCKQKHIQTHRKDGIREWDVISALWLFPFRSSCSRRISTFWTYDRRAEKREEVQHFSGWKIKSTNCTKKEK